MGQDTALLEFHRGEPVLVTLVGTLAQVSDDLLVVGGERARFRGQDFFTEVDVRAQSP